MKAAALISLSQKNMESHIATDEGRARFIAMLGRLWRIGYSSSVSRVLTDSIAAAELCAQNGIGVEIVSSEDFLWPKLAERAAETGAGYTGVFSARSLELAERLSANVWPFLREQAVHALVPVTSRQFFSMDFWCGELDTGVRRVFRKPPISSPCIITGARICPKSTWERIAAGEPLRAMMVPCSETVRSTAVSLQTRREGVWEIVAPSGTNFDVLIDMVGKGALEDTSKPILILEEDRGELMNMPFIWNQARSYLVEPAALDDLPKFPTGPEDNFETTGLFRQSTICRFHRVIDSRGPAYWDDDYKGIKFGSELGELPGQEYKSAVMAERILFLKDLCRTSVIPYNHCSA